MTERAPLMRPLWRNLPLCVLFALVAAVGRVTVPFTAQRMTDSITTDSAIDVGMLAVLAVAALAVLTFASICGSLLGYQLNHAVETVLADLRGRMLLHLHSLTELDRRIFRRGALMSRLTSDLEQITGFLQRGGAYVVLNIAQLVLTLSLMLYYSWSLTLVVVVLLLPLTRVLPVLHRRLSRSYADVQEHNSRMLTLVGETLAGAVVIRAYGVQRSFASRISAAIEQQYSAQCRAQRVAAHAFAVGEATVAIVTAAILLAGMALGAGGNLTLGELTAFLFLTSLLTQPLQATAENLNDLQNAVVATKRVRQLLGTPPSVTDPPPHETQRVPQVPLGIEVNEVRFTYPSAHRPAVSGVSFSIRPGQKLAIVGGSGSGKSTLLKLITRGIDPCTGKVCLTGNTSAVAAASPTVVDLRHLQAADLRSTVHLVPQDCYLFGDTIADNIRLAAPTLGDDVLHDAFHQLGLTGWLATVPDGINTLVGDGGRFLSAGERQLIALTRAYVANPPVLLLDEATSNVDPLTESRIVVAMEAVSQGRTTVAVAHRLSTAERADEVVVMSAGHIAQRGPHAELVHEPGPYAILHDAWRRRTECR